MTQLVDRLREALAGQYRIDRELGRGGMATVYLAQDLRHDRPVALKVLHPDLAATLGPERFLREIKLCARLQHPHILTVLDSGEAAGLLWFTMPFVEGASLRDRMERERQLPVEVALQIGREAARALDYAHQHGVIHRDIKPENILLSQDGSTLVADFGIARAMGADERLTQTGFAIGTPAYMSPEQAAAEKDVDARTDIYSLGAVLYEMLAGEPPFTGPTMQAVIAKRLTEPAPSVRRVRPNVPEAIDQAIQRALAPVPADRFADAGALSRALQATAETPARGTEAATVLSRDASPKRRPVPTLALTLVVGFLLGLGVLFGWRFSRGGASASSSGAKVLAVLPFENRGDSTTEYFADGVTDAVRGKLSTLPGLQVIASTSSNQYKHSGKSLPEIARELGADYLLIARIRWATLPDGTSRVEVSPELVEVGPGQAPTTKWQRPFDAAITDVFTVQADIAEQVAAALNLALATAQKQTLTERPTQNLAAYDALLKGDAAGGLSVSGAQTLRASINYYEQAVALDSTFAEAWAKLSRAQGKYYYNITPIPAMGEAAKRAADRSLALAPGRPDAWMALCEYHQTVVVEYARALPACQKGLLLTPENTDLLTAAALAQQGLGQWDAALQSLEKAQRLDPRSAVTSRRLSFTLLRLHRLPEAIASADRGLAVSPDNLDLIETKAMVYAAQGDLAGARRVIASVPPEVETTTLVLYFGNYWDFFWVLDDSHQRLLLRLPPGAFDGDRGAWGLIRAQTYHVRGDSARTRIYADSARLGLEQTLAQTPNDAQRRILHGLALAYLGRKAAAISEGERGYALQPPAVDGYAGPYLLHVLIRIYILAGEYDPALDRLETLMKMPYFLTPAWLRIDPAFDPLRNHPRFQRLVAGAP